MKWQLKSFSLTVNNKLRSNSFLMNNIQENVFKRLKVLAFKHKNPHKLKLIFTLDTPCTLIFFTLVSFGNISLLISHTLF